MNGRTRMNIEAALAGEAMAALRYQLFAEQAKHEGLPQIADLFRSVGRQERTEHFRELAADFGLIGTTRDNLRLAVLGEVAEHRTLYPEFARLARQDGDESVATRFEELGADEREHAEMLRKALEDLDGSELEVVGG